MAIVKVATYESAPTTIADYQAQNAHLQAFINQFNSQQNAIQSDGTIAMGSYIQFGGSLYQVQDEDYTITGSAPASGATAYVRVQTDDDTLEASWEYTITSYVWNTTYNYFYLSPYALLPYRVGYDGSAYYVHPYTPWTNQKTSTTSDVTFGNLSVTGAITSDGNITSGGAVIRTVSAGDYQKQSLTSSTQSGEDTYQDAGITIRVPSNIKGVIRLKINLNFSAGVSGTTQTYTRTYKNGALLYTDNFADDNIYTSTINFTHDITVSAGDYFTFTTYSDETNTRQLTASSNIAEYLW